MLSLLTALKITAQFMIFMCWKIIATTVALRKKIGKFVTDIGRKSKDIFFSLYFVCTLEM